VRPRPTDSGVLAITDILAISRGGGVTNVGGVGGTAKGSGTGAYVTVPIPAEFTNFTSGWSNG